MLPWARWTWVVLSSLGILWSFGILIAASLDVGIGAGLAIFALWLVFPTVTLALLLAPKSRVVFSPTYRDVVARTPHIRYQMNRRARRILIIALIGLPAAILVIAALLSQGS